MPTRFVESDEDVVDEVEVVSSIVLVADNKNLAEQVVGGDGNEDVEKALQLL